MRTTTTTATATITSGERRAESGERRVESGEWRVRSSRQTEKKNSFSHTTIYYLYIAITAAAETKKKGEKEVRESEALVT